MVVLERGDDLTAPPSAFPPRLAILSVHLKSGGKGATVRCEEAGVTSSVEMLTALMQLQEEEVRKVAGPGVRACMAALERGGGLREGDAVVVIGETAALLPLTLSFPRTFRPEPDFE